jgi:NADH:ubiquinone oxidoreductase subunit F (NADH-binding)
VSYEGLAAAGGGLGSAGFIVFDETSSMLSVARLVSRFVYVESYGQCRACQFGTGEITRGLNALAAGADTDLNIRVIGQRLRDVTNQNRSFLEEEQRVISSLFREFPND